jgi:hypothetical protein
MIIEIRGGESGKELCIVEFQGERDNQMPHQYIRVTKYSPLNVESSFDRRISWGFARKYARRNGHF